MAARRSQEEWQRLVREQQLSGESQVSFCKSRGLSLATFQYQVKKSKKSEFVELSLSSSQNPKNQERVEARLELPGGAVLRFSW